MKCRYALMVEYDGTRFSGWARQKNQPKTVQGVLEKAIYKFSGENVFTQGAGRTDAGVHAYGQVCHLDLHKEWEPWRVRDALNFYLTHKAISVVDVKRVDDNFHATLDATARHYMYHILCRPAKPVVLRNRCCYIRHELDVESMQQAANHLLGQHDFTSFRRISCQARTPVRNIFSAKFERQDDHIYFNIIGKSFLYNQVRIMIGTLVQVGLGNIMPEEFKSILDGRDRDLASMTLAPYGLYFKRVFYPAHLSPFGHVWNSEQCESC